MELFLITQEIDFKYNIWNNLCLKILYERHNQTSGHFVYENMPYKYSILFISIKNYMIMRNIIFFLCEAALSIAKNLQQHCKRVF